MNKRHYEHTLPNIRGSLSNTYDLFAPEQIARYVLCSTTPFLQHKTLALAEG